MALLIAAIKCFRGKFTGFQKCYFSSQTKNVIVVLLLLLFIKKISIEQIISSNCLFKKKSKPHAHTTISKVCKSRFNINLVWKFFCCTSSGRETKLEKKEKKKNDERSEFPIYYQIRVFKLIGEPNRKFSFFWLWSFVSHKQFCQIENIQNFLFFFVLFPSIT